MKNILEIMNEYLDKELNENSTSEYFPAPIKKVGNKIHIDLTEPGAYLPSSWYHPEDDIYED